MSPTKSKGSAEADSELFPDANNSMFLSQSDRKEIRSVAGADRTDSAGDDLETLDSTPDSSQNNIAEASEDSAPESMATESFPNSIWTNCLPPGKIIPLFYYNTVFRSHVPAPIGLRINHESRMETLRHYQIFLAHSGSLEYWDKSVDTIHHVGMPFYMAAYFLEMMLKQSPTPALTKAELAQCQFVEFIYSPCIIGLQMFIEAMKSWTKAEWSTASTETAPSVRSYYPHMKILRLEPDGPPENDGDDHQRLVDLLSAYQQTPPEGWAIQNNGKSIEIQILDSSREKTWTWYLPVTM
ncbi:hypothetical protein DL98DRAFT_536293 [Cadophora sp. DSE1049]|nr:hypothetical protein DL98DRAFT_536293 [Cadophora sp. DSE1049]